MGQKLSRPLSRPIVWGLNFGLVGIGYSLVTSWLAFGSSSPLDALFILYDPIWFLMGVLVRSGMVDELSLVIIAPLLHFLLGFLVGFALAHVNKRWKSTLSVG